MSNTHGEWLDRIRGREQTDDDETVFVLTQWGCMKCVLEDYGFDTGHITAKMGEHMVDDFLELMVNAGHIGKVEEQT